MRIISYNVNGIRAAIKKGLIEWLETDPAEIICLQELKAHEADIDKEAIEKAGYTLHVFCAQKKGYSGVAILSKTAPDFVECGHNKEQSDLEGRVIRADFGNLTIINAYFPSGTTGGIRQEYKYQWLDEFMDFIDELKKNRKKIIICGDYNIAHTEIDIHDPKGNKKSSGFLPEERAWFDRFLASGFVDSFRHLNKEPNHYSWWSVRRPTVRLENKGWRIDYISVTENLKDKIIEARIFPEIKHSDHCPIYLKLEQ